MSLAALIFALQISLPATLEGKWLSACVDGKAEGIPLELPVNRVRVSASFYGARTSLEYLLYTDSECAVPQSKYAWQGSYEATENRAENSTGIIKARFDRALLMPLSAEAVDELNLVGAYCGGADWQVGDLRDVTACDHRVIGKTIQSSVRVLDKDTVRIESGTAGLLLNRNQSL